MSFFDRKTAIIKLLKTHAGKEFTASKIATWLVDTYPQEAKEKEEASNDKRLLNAKSKVRKRKIIIMIYRNELNKLLTAIQKIEPKIKITKRGRWFRYCYVNNIDNIVNHDNKCHKILDLKFIIIKFLKANAGKEFTASQIAVWIVETYSQETARKVQTSNDKLLISVNKMSDKKEIAILLYKNEMKTLLPTTIPKIEPNIKIIKKGRLTKYCYVNNTDRAVNYNEVYYKKFDRKTAVIELLKAHPGKEFSNSQIAAWIVNTYPEEMERKIQTSNDKRLLSTKNKVTEKKIVIIIYGHELNRLLRTISKIEPNIKIIKKGNRAKYCYINNTDTIFDTSKIIKALENHKKQDLTAMEMAQLLLSANSK